MKNACAERLNRGEAQQMQGLGGYSVDAGPAGFRFVADPGKDPTCIEPPEQCRPR
jgi:hypothetical protein